MSITERLFNCPICNAPFPAKSFNEKVVVCDYCGQPFANSIEEDGEDETDTQLVLMPTESDSTRENALIEKLVLTDDVPVDVFNSLTFEDVRHNLYPVYIFDVNWSANWSAVYSKTEYYRVPDYDSQGNRVGMKTETETIYRDANGTSAGDAMVIVPGLSKGFAHQSEICTKFERLLSQDPSFIEKEAKQLSDLGTSLEEWKRNRLDLNEKEAWSRNGEKSLAPYVNDSVFLSVLEMANGFLRNNHNYTYQYRYNLEEKVLIPVWETDFSYEGKSYTASIEAWQNTLCFEDCPKNELAGELDKETKNCSKGIRDEEHGVLLSFLCWLTGLVLLEEDHF